MRRLIFPLLSLGAVQWLVLAWWWKTEGVTADVSLATILFEQIGWRPVLPWASAQWLLWQSLTLTPGGLCLILAVILLLREQIRRLFKAGRRHGNSPPQPLRLLPAAAGGWRRKARP